MTAKQTPATSWCSCRSSKGTLRRTRTSPRIATTTNPTAKRISTPTGAPGLFATARLADRVRGGPAAHLQRDQPSDEDREVELAEDPLRDGRIAGLQCQRDDVAEADGRQRGQAEIDEDREEVLLILQQRRVRGRRRAQT